MWARVGRAGVDSARTMGNPRRVVPRSLGRFARNWGLTFAAALPALLLMGVFLDYYAEFVCDDAFISFRYADHLATGRGLEWNPGYRVEGYTNFLWVVLTAGLRLLGVAAEHGARAWAWLCCAATLILTVAAVRREQADPKDRPAHPALSWPLLVLAPLPLVLSFSYQYWTALRLETPLFALLLLLGVILFVAEERSSGPRWISALAYLALALTRPEGVVFIAVPAVYLLSRVRSLADLRRLLRERAIWLAVFFAGFLLYTTWRLVYFGELLPNTYYAKVGGEASLAAGWGYLVRFATRADALGVLAVILMLGGTASRTVRLLLGTLVALCAVVVLAGGDWMREFRLLVPALPLLATALGISLQRFAAGLSRYGRIAPIVGMACFCLLVQGTLGTPYDEWGAAWRGQRRDLLINLEGEMTRVSAEVATWLKARAEPDDLIAVNHAGALPYYSDLPTLDMAGLNDLHIARIAGMRHRKWDPNYVMSRKPAFVVLNTHARPVKGRYVPGYWDGETALFHHPEFRRRYEPVKKIWTWRHRSVEVRNYPLERSAYIMVFRRVSRPRRVGSCLDFETGTYVGWKVEGRAFGKRPSQGPLAPRVWGFQGQFLASSIALPAQQGILRSQPFQLQGSQLELLLGGSANLAQTGARLLDGDKVLRRAAGKNDGELRRVVWDVADLRGSTVVVEIYDNGPGYVLADDLCQTQP